MQGNSNVFEKGFTLVEVLIAMALFSITVLAFTFALQTATKARALAQDRTIAENLAISTIETVQAEPYISAASGSVASYSVVNAPPNFTIATLDRNNDQVDGVVYGVPWNTTTNTAYTGNDPKIQRITVIVDLGSKEVFRLKDYKVNVTQ